MAYLYLLVAILAEVAGTLSLRASEGFTKFGYSAGVVVGYVVAFALLSKALQQGMPLGVAYGIWSAIGTGLVAVFSVVIFDEALGLIQVGGLALVMVGVFALEFGAGH